jgi:PAS domain S-box-containing protein
MQTNTISWSDELFSIYGLSQQQFTPNSGSNLKYIHPDDKEFVTKITSKVYKDKKPISINYRIIDSNQKERTIHEEVRPILDVDSNIVKMYGTQQDVTETKKMEEEFIQ